MHHLVDVSCAPDRPGIEVDLLVDTLWALGAIGVQELDVEGVGVPRVAPVGVGRHQRPEPLTLVRMDVDALLHDVSSA